MSVIYGNTNYNSADNCYHNNEMFHWGFQSCECCPYGYHIDLDFVRYCESLDRASAARTDTMDRRRERRRQRQSMEVMLGLITPIKTVWNTNQAILQESNSPVSPQKVHLDNHNDNVKLTLVQDALGDVVSDFEQTQQQFAKHNSINNNFNNINQVDNFITNQCKPFGNDSMDSISSVFGMQTATNKSFTGDLDTPVNNGHAGLSPGALRSIREQMAVGLERMKELEEKVKLIPSLQVQVAVLKDEKRKLVECLKELQQIDTANNKKLNSQKDIGIMCGVIMRHVGVGPNYPKTRENATITDEHLSNPSKTLDEPTLVSQSSQTKVQCKEANTQIPTVRKRFVSTSTHAKPETKEFIVQVETESKSVGVSDDDVNSILCLKCSTPKRTIGIGPLDYDQSSINLKSLTVPKSKSFNLGNEKLNLNLRYRTIGCQSENFSVNKSCQYEAKLHSQFSQTELKTRNEGVQYENMSVNQITDTNDLQKVTKDASCATIRPICLEKSSNTPPTEKPLCNICKERADKKNVSCETNKIRTADIASNTDSVSENKLKCDTCDKETRGKKDSEREKDSNVLVSGSRIPRPAQTLTPTEVRKFKRQDTYTKLSTEELSLSGLDLSPTTASKIDLGTIESKSFNKNKQQNRLVAEAKKSSSQSQTASAATVQAEGHSSNGHSQTHRVQLQKEASAAVTPLLDVPPYLDRSHREKYLPSKEMQAAMKVLNDSLQKSKNNCVKNQVQRALDIIQQEWFKISSTASANPLNVEDYLDCFEEISSALLQFIVNMTDDSGNTAMHYAVSHANFDVVSILLDSKVCNINKTNKAGYTSVMLVSLTEIRSPTHTTVVKKLFQLADVNIRARQHGQTALMLAVSHGRLDMVQMLVEAGADINIQDDDGSTALMCAAEHGHIDIIKYFLNQPDCDSSIVDADGSSALKIALEAGHKDIGVLLYAHEHSIRGTSPLTTGKHRKLKGSSSKSSMTSLSQTARETKPK